MLNPGTGEGLSAPASYKTPGYVQCYNIPPENSFVCNMFCSCIVFLIMRLFYCTVCYLTFDIVERYNKKNYPSYCDVLQSYPNQNNLLELYIISVTFISFLKIYRCVFPSGNHWIHEIVELLLNQKAELTETTIAGFMLEFCNLSLLQDTTCKTTRVLHTHLPYRFLSTSKLIGQCKIIVIVRNPKDTCVSYHNHSKKDIFINYDISWNEFFEKWMTEEGKYHFQNFRMVCLVITM